MAVELFGEKKFLEAVKSSDGVWVLFSSGSVYVLKEGSGVALPVWSSQAEADGFASDAGRAELKPVFIPLNVLTSSAWLKSDQMGIVQVLASPIYMREALTYSVSELCTLLET